MLISICYAIYFIHISVSFNLFGKISLSFMTSLCLFNYFEYRNGICLFFRAWNQPPRTAQEIEDCQSLVFGLLFSMKAFVNTVTPKRYRKCISHHIIHTYLYHYLLLLCIFSLPIPISLLFINFVNVYTHVYRLNEYQNETIHNFSTSEYKLHYLESPSGLRICMTTDPNTGLSLSRARSFFLFLKIFIIYLYKIFIKVNNMRLFRVILTNYCTNAHTLFSLMFALSL